MRLNPCLDCKDYWPGCECPDYHSWKMANEENEELDIRLKRIFRESDLDSLTTGLEQLDL